MAKVRMGLIGVGNIARLHALGYAHAMLLDAAPVVVYRDGVTTNYSDMETDWSTSFVAGCNEFADCIVEGRQAKLTAEDGKKVVQMCRGIELSARESREVVLDDRVE